MVRITNAVASRRRKNRMRKRAKGFVGDRKNHLRLTRETVLRALAFNYRHRKRKKSDFRRLWITRVGAAAKINGMSYSKLIHGLKVAKCEIDRKMLADMAVRDPNSFTAVCERAKGSLAS